MHDFTRLDEAILTTLRASITILKGQNTQGTEPGSPRESCDRQVCLDCWIAGCCYGRVRARAGSRSAAWNSRTLHRFLT